MDRGDLVLVFQVQGNEFIGSVDAVHEVRASLDHTLVDQFLERLFLANDTQVEQELIPETAVNQVAGSVFRTTDI